MRKGIITLLFLFLFVSVYCQNHTSEELGAKTFFRLNYPYGSSVLDEPSIDTSLIYKNLTIVNFDSPQGFVIIRSLPDGNDVMGYSYSNQFSFTVDTTGALELLADALSNSIEKPGYNPEETIPKLKSGRFPVEPLCQTTWNQGWPYNYYCPRDIDEDQRTLVGCVAVAFGQIIRYYDKWNDFQIQHSYQHDKYGTLSCNAGSYNWLGMENQCVGINFDVAKLLSHAGILVEMNYGIGASGAPSDNASGVLNLIYNGGQINNDPYGSQDEFYKSLSQYKPIYSTYVGHAFVCDGFDGNDYYHFNLGWGGSANGYYPLSSVTGKALRSAIFNTSPVDSLKIPGHLKKSIISDTEVEISWNGPEGDRSNLLGYNIYLDDVYFAETTDTVFNHSCQPGSHYLRVTARYSTGESRWIGPASYFSHSDPVPIANQKLRVAVNTRIGIPSSQRVSHVPTAGELSDIKYLSVTNVEDLTGIAFCKNLRQVTLLSSSSLTEIDLTELQDCSEIAILKITNYQLLNPEALSFLTKMQDLKLVNNSLTEYSFLSTLKNLDKIELNDNTIQDVAFLNDLDRLTTINMAGCGIQSFEQLENTFGLEYLDISNNLVSDIEWLNGNRTLRTLDASNNQLAGEISLDGLSLLRTLILPDNQIQKLNVSNSPQIRTINLADNKIQSIYPVINENEILTVLDVSGNLIDSLPAIENDLVDLDLGNNFIIDLVSIENYGSMKDLDLRGNRITDLYPLLFKSYANKLDRLNLRDNPISKESYLEHKPLISQLAGSVYFPTGFYPASPCYLEPGGDSVIMNRIINLIWEADYEDQGYLYDLYLSREQEAYSLMATGLINKSHEIEVAESGNYSWYVVARLEEDSLYSGYAHFKVFSGFTVPFFEDFEIYTPNVRLCTQTPYWRIFGEDQSASKDAYVVDIRSFEGDKSIKVAGGTDLLFPITEYLTGYCDIKFMFMIDRNRQATIKTMLSDGTEMNIYFYAAGICEVFIDQTRQKFFSYNAREWMEMEISSDPSRGLTWKLDNNEFISINEAQPMSGLRFCTLDGPGYYESAPTVLYIDNFAVESGTLLSASSMSMEYDFTGKLYYNGENIIIENPPIGMQYVELYNLNGQLIESCSMDNRNSGNYEIPISTEENIIIAVLRDSRNRLFTKKIFVNSR